MSESAYDLLASIYDLLQKDIDTSAWADYICSIDSKYNRRSGQGDGNNGRPLLLDLGCATGSFCLEIARRGYDPIGIDSSPAMLAAAREKWLREGEDNLQALFLLQDISNFELYGTVDIIVCLLDTINHLTRPKQVESLFRLSANYLNPGGLLVFDLLNYNYMSKTLGNNFFFQDEKNFTLFWQNHFRRQSGTSRSELTFFLRQRDGSYQRADEQIREKYYSLQDVKKWLEDLPLELLSGQAKLPNRIPKEKQNRQVYIIRKNIPDQEK